MLVVDCSSTQPSGNASFLASVSLASIKQSPNGFARSEHLHIAESTTNDRQAKREIVVAKEARNIQGGGMEDSPHDVEHLSCSSAYQKFTSLKDSKQHTTAWNEGFQGRTSRIKGYLPRFRCRQALQEPGRRYSV